MRKFIYAPLSVSVKNILSRQTLMACLLLVFAVGLLPCYASGNIRPVKKATKIIKATSNSAELTGLTLNVGTLTPAFDAATTNYTATVDGSTSVIHVTSTVAGNEDIVVNGTPTGSEIPVVIGLSGGNNTVTIQVTNTVTDEVRTYTIVVKRNAVPQFTYPATNTFVSGTAISPVTPQGGAADAPSYHGKVAHFNTTGSLLYGPTGITTDKDGFIYVSGAGTVRRFTSTGQQAGHSQFPQYSFYDRNTGSRGMAFDAAGYLYSAGGGNGKIYRTPPGGGDFVSITIGGDFSYPYDIKIDGKGYIYVADGEVGVIRLQPGTYTRDTLVSELGIYALAVDKEGNVYYHNNNRVKRLAAGESAPVDYATVTGTTENGMDVDAGGNVYIAFQTRLLRVDAIDRSVTTLVSDGYTIRGLTITPNGRLLYTDDGPNPSIEGRVWRIDPMGGYHSRLLPAGLSLNTVTGVISGTPGGSGVSAANYTIWGYNNNGGSSFTTSITINSADAGLANLVVDSATLWPAFNTDSLSYRDTVAITLTGIKVTPTLSDSTAILKVNGNTVASGIGVDIPLAYGDNTITIEVTASAGNTQTYTYHVLRPVPPPVFSYAAVNLPVNTTISPLVPTSELVDPWTYSTTKTTLSSFGGAPMGLTTDRQGNIYVALYAENRVAKFSPDGSSENIGSGFLRPSDVEIDSAGNVYVADQGNKMLKKIPAGTNDVETLLTNTEITVTAIDSAGNIFFNPRNTNLIRKWSVADSTVVDIVSTGFVDFRAIAVDHKGFIYAADSHPSGNRVRKYNPDGSAIGNIGSGFDYPNGIAIDAAGNVFVASGNNRNVYKIPAGTNTTIEISGATEYQASGMTIDYKGNLYLTDRIPDALVRLSPVGGYILGEPLPNGLSFDSSTGVVSGTPTEVRRAKNYPVTAYNYVGANTEHLNLKVGSNDASVNAIILSKGTLSPMFLPFITSYEGWVKNEVTSLKVAVYGVIGEATITVNGEDIGADSLSNDIALNEGDNTIEVEVTADDAITTKTYTIVVHRQISPPSLSYPAGLQTYATESAIAPLTPTAGDVHAPGYSSRIENISPYYLNSPMAVATDDSANVYTAMYDGAIIKFPADGGDAIKVDSTTFTFPMGLAADANGNLYVADMMADHIVKLPAGGGLPVDVGPAVSFANSVAVDSVGNVYYTSVMDQSVNKIDVTAGTSIQLPGTYHNPYSIAIDADENIYVADAGLGGENSSVKKIIAGTDSVVNVGSGFNSASSVAVDAAGDVFVADIIDSAVVKIAAADSAKTVVASGIDGIFGLALHKSGRIYVSDNTNGRILEISPDGGYILGDALPKGLVLNTTTGIISGTPTKRKVAKTYTVTAYNSGGGTSATVDILVKSGNAFLTSLTTSSADTLAPAFNSQVLEYNLTTTDSVLVLTPTAVDSVSVITIAGNVVPSGSAADTIALLPEANVINILVAAEDGSTTKTYKLNVFRAADAPPVFTYGDARRLPPNIAISPITPVANSVYLRGYQPGTTPLGLSFGSTRHMAADGKGNVYLAAGGRLKRINVDSTITDLGAASSAVATDAEGNVYIAVSGAVKMLPANGGPEVTYNNSLTAPYGMAVDRSGIMYVADMNVGINRIMPGGGTPVRIIPSSTIPTVAVDGDGVLYYADIMQQLIMRMQGSNFTTLVTNTTTTCVAVDPMGDLYYGDFKTLKKIAKNTTTQQILAVFDDVIFGVTPDAFGNVYVAHGTTVDKVTPSGGIYLGTPLPAGLSFDKTTGTISGTPNLSTNRKNYLVSAYNSAGGTTDSLDMIITSPTAELTGLLSSIGPLNPVFDKFTTNYRQFVNNNVTGVTFAPASALSGTITINDTDIASGDTSAVLPLNEGDNVFAIKVTSSDSTQTRTYTVTINRNGTLPTITYNTGALAIDIGSAITPLAPVTTDMASVSLSNTVIDPGFTTPTGIATDTAGYVYVIDNSIQAIKKINRNTNEQTTAADLSGLNTPSEMVVDEQGYFYVASYGNITKISPANGSRSTILSDPGTFISLGLDNKRRILYAAERNFNTVLAIPLDNIPTTEPVGSGWDNPSGVAVDNDGNVYVVEFGQTGNNALKKINRATDNSMVTLASRFVSVPLGVAVNPAGDIFVTGGSSGLVKISPDGSSIVNYGTGINYGRSVAIDDGGIIYVVNSNSSPVDRFVAKVTPLGSFYINQPLPAGLAFDTVTGAISGTPTASSPATNYKVTTFNEAGAGVTTVNIKTASPNANLASLAISAGILSPAFDENTLGYTATVHNLVTSVNITPTAANANATIKIGSTTVTSGDASTQSLNVGSNMFQVEVTAENGTLKTYTLTVTRDIPAPPYIVYDAGYVYVKQVSITPVTPAGGGVSPLAYADPVGIAAGPGIPKVVTVDTAGNIYAAISDNGVIVKMAPDGSGRTQIATADLPLGLEVDTAGNLYYSEYHTGNLYKVPAGGGTAQLLAGGLNYPAGIAIAPNGNYYVASRGGKAIKMVPAGGGTAVNIATFDDEINDVAVDLSGNIYASTGKTGGRLQKIPAGSTTPEDFGPVLTWVTNLALNAAGDIYTVNSNTAQLIHISPDGTATNLSQPPSVTLQGIAVDGKGNVLTGSFNSEQITRYTPAGGYYLDKPLPKGLTFNSATGAISGTPLVRAITNNYTVTGYNGEGPSSTTFSITVNAAAPVLDNIALNTGTLSPVFDGLVTNYTADVDYQADTLQLSPIGDPAYAVKVNGNTVDINQSVGLPLTIGDNAISVEVIAAEDGLSTIYNLTVTRLQSTNAKLAGLSVSNTVLSPGFEPNEVNYTAEATSDITYVTITPVADSVQVVEVDGQVVPYGQTSQQLPVSVGDTTYVVKVTSQDGANVMEYNVTVVVYPSISLQNITINDDATFEPAFHPDSTIYAITVADTLNELIVTPTAVDAEANVYVNGELIIAGESSSGIPLTTGNNAITVEVYSVDYSRVKTYTLNVTRQGTSDATLASLTVQTVSLSPAFDSDVSHYNVNVPMWINYLQLTPTATDNNATITIDGEPVTSGNEGYSPYLPDGQTDFDIVVTSSDGTQTKTYTITANKGEFYPEIYYYNPNIVFAGAPIEPIVPFANNVEQPGVYTSPYVLETLPGLNVVAVEQNGNVIAGTNTGEIYRINGVDEPELITGGLGGVIGLKINKAGDIFTTSPDEGIIYKIPAGTTTPVVLVDGLSQPAGLTFDADENLYLTDVEEGTVTRFSRANGYATGETITEGLVMPFGIAVDNQKNIYVGEIATGKVVKLLAADTYQTQNVFVTSPGMIYGLTMDGSDNLYLTLPMNGVVVKYSPAGGAPVEVASSIAAANVAFTTDGRLYISGFDAGISAMAPMGGYYIDKQLPAGLSFNDTTGVVSGTPLAASPNTKYKVTGWGLSGSGEAELQLAVEYGNAYLFNLSISDSYLAPYFQGGRYTYSAGVAEEVTAVNFVPEAEDEAAIITVNGIAVVSGQQSADVPLNVGNNAISVVVTSANGLATKTYTVIVNRGEIPPQVSYSGSTTKVYTVNTAIEPLSLVSNNINPPGYGCTPDQLTGDIAAPFYITMDGAGNLYSSDDDDGTIYKVQPDGTTELYSSDFVYAASLTADAAGNLLAVDYEDGIIYKVPAGGGPRVVVSDDFAFASAITLDTDGNLYVVDGAAGVIKKIKAGSHNATTLASDNFSSVSSIKLDGDLNIYLGTFNGQVKKLLAANNYNTSVITADGMGAVGGIALDAAGNLYVSDLINGMLNKIAKTGEIETISSCMIAPAGVLVDEKGKLYVADVAYGSIDYFSPVGGFQISSLLPAGLSFNDTTGVISGTPILPKPAKDYTITGYNPFGSSEVTVNITVIPDVFNADLSKLGVSGVSLMYAHRPDRTTNRASVKGTITSVRVKPTAAAVGSTITVNDEPVVSGTLSQDIALDMGSNHVVIVVTAADGHNTKTYNLYVGRGNNDAKLQSMVFSPTAKLEPAGNTGSTINYTASVATGTTRITLKPLARDKYATVEVNGVIVPRGSSTGYIDLEPTGPTVINMVITAQDGVTTSIHSISVVREGSNNAFLKLITLDPASTLVKTSSTDVVKYTTAVDWDVTRVRIRPIAEDKNATITVNGTPIESGKTSDYIDLEETGPTVISLHVVAQDGVTTKDYTVSISRTGSNNAKLQSIVLSPTATLVSAPTTGTINYTASVDASATQIKLKPIAQNKYATILVNGVVVPTGTNSGLIDLEPSGPTIITLHVTAQDGVTTQGYTVTVNRNGSNNAKLAGVTLNKSSTVTETSTGYTASVDAVYGIVRVRPMAEDKNATVMVDGITVARGSYSGDITLNDDGATLVTINVTAQDGVTTKDYILAIYRNGSNNAKLRSVTLKPSVVVTETSSTTYTATVSSSTDTVAVKALPESSNATLTVDGVPVPNGLNILVPVNMGANVITIVVTAQDGVTVKTYKLIVTRSSLSLMAIEEEEQTALNRVTHEVVVAQALSPNGDGMNDILTITGIEAHPENSLAVMNSKGVQVNYISGYNNTTKIFDGRNRNGVLQPAGTYFYLLEYKDGNEVKRKSGYIVLKY